jgi:hypothetical protein
MSPVLDDVTDLGERLPVIVLTSTSFVSLAAALVFAAFEK